MQQKEIIMFSMLANSKKKKRKEEYEAKYTKMHYIRWDSNLYVKGHTFFEPAP